MSGLKTGAMASSRFAAAVERNEQLERNITTDRSCGGV